MAYQTWQTLVNAYQFSGINAGTALVNTVTETDISPGANVTGQALQIPAGFLVAGNIIRVTASGWYSNVTAKKPTINWFLTFGGIAAGKKFAETEALTTVEGVKEYPWRWESITRILSAGETGKAQTTGYLQGSITPTEAAATAGASSYLFPKKSKTGAEVAINTGVATNLTLAVKYSEAAGAEQELQCIQWLVEILN